MSLPLLERATSGSANPLVRMTAAEIFGLSVPAAVAPSLIPDRPLEEGEQYRFHFNMTKCIGCRSCEVACNEQNGNPAEINWRRIGEIEGGSYPETQRHYLSMGCNHCLDADCVKGCPVNAYTKDPITGIVLHSAEACIGCQYCVWNCPYSVPQFNPERGVVGKCDMCHGRLTDGLEPACVNACPEAAIEIEIVNMAAWRADFSTAESPGMPTAAHTISTTRITLPPATESVLERVDIGRIRPERAHASLVFMTTLIQATVGSLLWGLLFQKTSAMMLTLLLLITAAALNISIFHLGRPAYAWRALKMWRRSWLSREVLLFALFFLTLAATTLESWLESWTVSLQQSGNPALAALVLPARLLPSLAWLTAFLGVAGIVASAFIYLVPARPAWNMVTTPIDFLVSGALLGCTLPVFLGSAASWLSGVSFLHSLHLPRLDVANPTWLQQAAAATAAVLWLGNQGVRLLRLNRSQIFEHRATASLLNTSRLRSLLLASLACVLLSAVLAARGWLGAACLSAFAGVLLARYLFFVSVVPLNMALTFVRGGR